MVEWGVHMNQTKEQAQVDWQKEYTERWASESLHRQFCRKGQEITSTKNIQQWNEASRK